MGNLNYRRDDWPECRDRCAVPDCALPRFSGSLLCSKHASLAPAELRDEWYSEASFFFEFGVGLIGAKIARNNCLDAIAGIEKARAPNGGAP